MAENKKKFSSRSTNTEVKAEYLETNKIHAQNKETNITIDNSSDSKFI